jgi:hypothetical protein
MVERNQAIRPAVIAAVSPRLHCGARMAMVALLTACGATVPTAATTSTVSPVLSPAASPSVPIPDHSRLACSTPPNRYGAGMAYMSNLGEAVMFGGVTRGGLLPVSDTWIWHGNCWSELHPAHHPAPYRSVALAFDATDGCVIAYLGEGDDPGQEQATWSWDGRDWTRMANGPTTYWAGAPDAAMAYDRSHGRVVLYGLTSQPLPNNASGSRPGGPQTWTWTGTRWQAMNPRHSPGPRIYTSMAYDPNTGKVLLFGGVSVETWEFLNDTWAWDGSDWQQPLPAHSPSARASATMVSFVAQSRVLLLGGYDVASRPEAWVWDGVDWASMPAAGVRDGAPAADLGSRVLVFGGTVELVGTTGFWDGHAWTTLTG